MSTHIPALLQPLLALNGWTLFVEAWMFASRIPVYSKLPEAVDPSTPGTVIDEKSPVSVRYKGDNFKHLFEQPVQFYAVTLALAIARHGEDNSGDLRLAWAYVGLRVLHSLIQCTGGKVLVRFGVFVASSVVLGGLTLRAALLAF